MYWNSLTADTDPLTVPVSAMPMLRTGALCFGGKSSGAALKLNVPSSFFIILKIRMASP